MSSLSLLIVAWYFPPDGGAGAQRPASFARLMPELGWATTVLTRGDDHDRNRWSSQDESLQEATGTDAHVERVAGSSPLGLHCPPMEHAIQARAGALAEAALTCVQREVPSVFLLTMSPFCLSSIVEPMSEQACADGGRTRIVVDLRDPWVLDFFPMMSRASHRRQHALMKRVLAQADGIVMNTPEAKRALLQEFGCALGPRAQERVIVIENGFSQSDFGSIEAVDPTISLKIVHAGTFHCEHLRAEQTIRKRLRALATRRTPASRAARTPQALLRAAHQLAQSDATIRDQLCFSFFGHIDPALERCVARDGAGLAVELGGYVAHNDLIRMLKTAGALYLPSAGLPSGTRDLIVPGKTYEYLASQRPIIAAIPEGDGRDLLAPLEGVFLCTPGDVHSHREALESVIAQWRSGALNQPIHREPSLLSQYERGTLAGKLDQFLRVICDMPLRRTESQS